MLPEKTSPLLSGVWIVGLSSGMELKTSAYIAGVLCLHLKASNAVSVAEVNNNSYDRLTGPNRPPALIESQQALTLGSG
jgi:hypothetical protein